MSTGTRTRGGSRARRPEPVSPATVERLPGGRRAPLWLLVPWLVVVVAAVAVLVEDRIGPDLLSLSDSAARVAGVVVSAAYAAALAHRAQGRPLVLAGLVVLLGAVALVTDEAMLLSGMAVATAVLAGGLAVAVTEPAPGALAAVRETLVAALVAAAGALAVASYDGAPDPVRLRLVALAATLAVLLVLSDRLGSGLAGLGRLARIALVVAVLVAVGAVAYREALAQWGSAGLVDGLADARQRVQDATYAVPVPLAAVLGFPSLVYGSWLRGRRRAGWWVCAFGAGATVPVATALVDPAAGVARAGLELGYSALIGVLIGLLVVRLDRAVTHG